ncbi:unnamed protein product [Pleuronectes platessa]|uniref:Voltage-dependent calcium channel gamma-1 subunit n=1 Tax=Pleuronectes platessa TaxID=8262 RepID=A0A9N7UAB5_PLEPL|nr:unnamed protein product [Pleuronectes platessa]
MFETELANELQRHYQYLWVQPILPFQLEMKALNPPKRSPSPLGTGNQPAAAPVAQIHCVCQHEDHKYNISAAAISIFSLAFMILGSLCLLGSCTGKGKGRDYLLKPAGMFFAFAGLCLFISLEVMRQSVKRMIESEDTIWIEYYYAWSFACACAGFVLLFLTGFALLILSMPQMPRNPWETCMDAEQDQVE